MRILRCIELSDVFMIKQQAGKMVVVMKPGLPSLKLTLRSFYDIYSLRMTFSILCVRNV